MAEGIEIVIDPKKLIVHGVYLVIIIVLIILLITHWSRSCDVDKEKAKGTINLTAGLNQTNQTANATNRTASLCANGIKDQTETDIDCGGAACPKCAEFKACNLNTDCATGWCRDQMKCLTPTCDDVIKNQDETDIDCGGKCTASKGSFYYDAACHKEAKPNYSGELKLSIKPETSLNADTALVKINTVTFTVLNDKDTSLIGAQAYIYAEDGRGSPFPAEDADGNLRVLNYPGGAIDIPTLSPGQSYNKTLNISKTLTNTEEDDPYSLSLEIYDTKDNLLGKQVWENP